MFQILKRVFSSNLKENGTNNIVNNQDFPNCKFAVFGNNNKIIISPNAKIKGEISVYGNENIIQIDEETILHGKIKIGSPASSYGCKAEGCSLRIGKNVHASENLHITLADDETKVSIGDLSVFEPGIQILASDMHSVVDDEGNLLNKASFVRIGKHVWFGPGCKILKNSVVNDECIVGAASIITHAFWEPHALIAGTPAKIIKHNIRWDILSPNLYEQQQKEYTT
ncbi:MAG: hypothetical protein J6Y03_02515 [Alphaproteobacteria bacterium]|nr:hypothetical protein [Alphaproteobacteria bacterium]